IGYMVQQSLVNALIREGIRKSVVTVITQVVVDKDDPSMLNPTKYVGPFIRAEDVEECRAKGWIVREDPGRGHRRVVPSPVPVGIVETEVIRDLLTDGLVVIAAGGGGIPVCRNPDGTYTGVDAVIDKDRASALLANLLTADELLILTGVEKVAVNYRKPDQRVLDVLTVAEVEKYLADGQFPKGSMGPKIEAAVDFLKRGGTQVIVTDLEHALAGSRGEAGTRIVP
ncbi:MAG TPA: carbamate kinase, partial [Magnetospirillaceae bacterium]|nr:carbamate kinase [Magnetospirillaceae bacterium]